MTRPSSRLSEPAFAGPTDLAAHYQRHPISGQLTFDQGWRMPGEENPAIMPTEANGYTYRQSDAETDAAIAAIVKSMRDRA